MGTYRKLFPFLKPHFGLLMLACVCMVASTIFKGVSLMMLAPVVDIVLLNQPLHLPAWLPGPVGAAIGWLMGLPPMARLHVLVGVTVLLFVLKNITMYGQTVFMNDVALRFLRDLRNSIYRQYQYLSVDFFGGERTGELVSRITYDVSILQNSLLEGLTDFVFQTSQAILFSAMVFVIDWKLAFVAIVLLPALGYPIIKIGRMLRKLGLVVQERMADINTRLIETLQGIRIIKAFTAERRETARFEALNHQYYKANIRTIKRRELLGGITDLIAMAGGLFVLEMGGRAIIQNQLTLGNFVLFLGALFSLQQPIKKLSRIYSINQEAISAAERIVGILETKPAISDKPNAQLLRPFSREIKFEKVFLNYEDRTPVLNGIDLSIKKGEAVALVGASGTGKTSLVNLLLRFYDPTGGRVMIDGMDIQEVTIESLRRQIGLVTQDPFLFHDSIRANIAYGVPGASTEEIIQAAQVANAHGFIQKLPHGYHTPVGELGAKFSGGERQRISIARAVLKDPPILILDEATSQLDSESEALVQEALERLMQGRTVFVISHRLSTLRKVDRIIVISEGKIAEIGQYDQLMRDSLTYRRLYELQFAQ